MDRIIGRYSNRNRLQVWLALIVFTICAWGNLNPLQFHLLDGMMLLVIWTAGAIINSIYPVPHSVLEIVFLLLVVSLPVVFYIYFTRVGAKYMASATFFWFAYLAEMGFRFFNGTIYRRQSLAMIMFILSLLLLVIGLLKCLHYSEITATEVSKDETKKADADDTEVIS